MDAIDKLIAEVTYLRRIVGNMIRPATVHEVKGDKVRMVVGKDKDGKDVLGPWLDTVSHRGGARERRFYKKGQNLMLLCPNGDLAQATIAPYAPNKDFKAPDHANETGQDEETFQLENLRVRKTKAGYAIWLQEPKQEQQQQTQDDPHKEATRPKREPQKPKADALIQISKDGGITGRVGKDVRFAAHKDGAKLKAFGNFTSVSKNNIIHKSSGNVYIDAGGTPFVSKEWQIGGAPSDPISDDDKVIDQDESSS